MDTTAPSLLLALLGFKNRDKLEALAKQATGEQAAGGKTPAEQLAAAVTPEEQTAAQAACAVKYFHLEPSKQKEVQEKLYKTLYAITEYPYLPQNRDLSMAMGKVLASSVLEGIKLQSNDYQQITKLGETLRRGVAEAIDEAAKG